jgi:hypothetical protein
MMQFSRGRDYERGEQERELTATMDVIRWKIVVLSGNLTPDLATALVRIGDGGRVGSTRRRHSGGNSAQDVRREKTEIGMKLTVMQSTSKQLSRSKEPGWVLNPQLAELMTPRKS